MYSKWWGGGTVTKNPQPGKAIIQIWRRRKSFTDKQKLKEFSITESALQEMFPRMTCVSEKEKTTTRNTKIMKWQIYSKQSRSVTYKANRNVKRHK